MTTRIGTRFPLSQIASVGDGGDAARCAGRARRRSLPRAHRDLGDDSDSSRNHRRHRLRCSLAIKRFRHCRDGRRAVALGDAGGAARFPEGDPHDVLRHADRLSLCPLLLHGPVRRPPLDLHSPCRRFQPYRAVPSCGLGFFGGSAANRHPGSPLVTDFYLCSRLSRYGDPLAPRVAAFRRLHRRLWFTFLGVVCALLRDDLRPSR